MNGFLISCFPHNAKAIRLKLPFPNFKSIDFSHPSNSCKIQFSSWGSNSGDVHFASFNDHCFLILSGYFSESKSLGSITDQAKAVVKILKDIDHSNPQKSLGNIAKNSFGSFSLLYINIKTKNIACVTDPINSRPLWYYFDSIDCWHFSTHVLPIKSMLDCPPYDFGSLASLLIYGGPVDSTKSVYKSVCSIPPGSLFSGTDDDRQQINRWYTFKHRPENKMSMSDWVQLGVERFRTAAHRHVSSALNSLIFLSGGVDSRLVACALRDAGIKPTLYTLSDSINIETRVAKLVANSLDCEHFIFQRDQHYYLDQIQNNMLESGGSYVWTHSHFSKAYRSILKQNEIDCAMLGDFCETFSKLFCTVDTVDFALANKENFLQCFDKLRPPLYRPANKNLTLTLFHKNIRNDILEELNRDIADQYQKHHNVSSDPSIVADHILRTGSAGTAPTFQMFLDIRSTGSERNLFLDRDVYSLLEILPSNIRNQAGFAAKIIYALSPKIALIPNANTLVPLHWPTNLHNKTKTLKPCIGSLKRKLVSNTHRTSGSWPKKEILYRNNSRWNNYLSSLFENGDLFDSNIFDFDVIKQFWNDYNNGRLQLSSDIERLIAIAEISMIESSN